MRPALVAGALEPSSFQLAAERVGGDGPRYERRRPELGTLHQVVRENLETLYAAVEQGFTSPLPDFVRRELEGFLDCGLLCRGFAMLECEDCDERRLVAFSCKGRGFCPSCMGRRMTQTALNLVDHILPRVPLRQFVLTVPFELRARLAYDGKLCGAVCRVFVDTVLGFYRRKMRGHGVSAGKSGAVTVVQRTSADLRLNPHFHTIGLDGVFVTEGDGEVVFHPLPELEPMDVADLLQVIRVRVLRLCVRRGVLEDDGELTVVSDELAEREPALAQLAAAAVSGFAPAGPERRDRPLSPVVLGGRTGVRLHGGLSASELGFSLHAATTATADDERGRLVLVRYVLRPPLAQERLSLLSDELVRIALRRPFADGTIAIDLDPLSLLCRLCAAVPAPRFHTVRYAGVLAPASRLRTLIVPPPPAQEGLDEASTPAPAPSKPPTHRAGWRRWAELMKRCWAVDVESCARCGRRMKLRRLILRPESIRRLLRFFGEPTEPPARAPARDPPFFKSRALRRRSPERSAPQQQPMFG